MGIDLGFRVSAQRVTSTQTADSLQWIAYALFLVFLAQVVASIYPVALIQPQWQLRMSGVLRGTAILPLMGVGLLLLANMIDPTVSPSSKQLRLIRRIATWAAVGYLLLIPLQTVGAVRNIRTEVSQAQAQINKLTTAANQLQQAANEQELRTAIRSIPGGEQIADRPLGADVQTIKTALLGRIRPNIKRFENQLKESQDKAIQNTIIPLFRDGLISIGYALGFAGLGYSSSGKPNLLRRILKPRGEELQKQLGSNWSRFRGITRKQSF